jgi:hypothetical protein
MAHKDEKGAALASSALIVVTDHNPLTQLAYWIV